MLISAISLILALLMSTYFGFLIADFDSTFLALLMVIGGTAVLIITPLMNALVLVPLQNLERHLAPRLMELFRHDKGTRLSLLLLFLFPLLSYFLAAILWTIHIPTTYKIILFAAWFVTLGITLDLIRSELKRWMRFLNPFHLIDIFSHEAKAAIQNGQDDLLWSSLDSLSELALRAVEESKVALGIQTLNAFPPLMHTFFASSKSISRINQDKQVEQKTGQDEASYTTFYLLQRLQLVNDRALSHRLDTICSQMIVILGKIIVYSAQFDLSMVSFPTHFLGSFALKAQRQDLNEVANIATSTLVEISKTILNDIDITYAELQEPFQTIINNLSQLAKGMFQKDKTINIQVLTQPLKELRALFQTEKMASHQDTPVIIQSIDQVLAEFAILEQVMRTLPPMPNLGDSASPSPIK